MKLVSVPSKARTANGWFWLLAALWFRYPRRR